MLFNIYLFFLVVGCIFNYIYGLVVVIKVIIIVFFCIKLVKNFFYFDKLGR